MLVLPGEKRGGLYSQVGQDARGKELPPLPFNSTINGKMGDRYGEAERVGSSLSG